jgi:fimbrial chaperone protein
MTFFKSCAPASVLIACLFTFLTASPAHATFITPKRVMIEDRERTATITILNRTDKTMAYRFEWERRSATADGQSVLLESGETLPGYSPADELLQFSPRQVMIKPGDSQKIRILVRRPEGLAEGEYRSNLLIKPEPVGDQNADPGTSPGGGFSGTFKVRANISIPVFLHQGKTSVNMAVKSVSLVKKSGRDQISLDLENNSTRSIYLKPELECSSGGTLIVSKPLPTVRLYSQVKTLHADMNVPKDFPLSQCSGLKLRFSALDDAEYKRNVVATVDVSGR